MKPVFVYIWEFEVLEEHIEEFKKVYGPEGAWVQLFKRSDGYISTDLHQDQRDSGRFITVDIWNSKDARDKFRESSSAEYDALDARCERLTTQEILIGEFDSFLGRLP